MENLTHFTPKVKSQTTAFCRKCYHYHEMYYVLAINNRKMLAYTCDFFKTKKGFRRFQTIFLPYDPNLQNLPIKIRPSHTIVKKEKRLIHLEIEKRQLSLFN